MADYKGLNIRFRGDTSDASKALHVLSSEARAAQGNLTGIQNALKETKTNGDALNDALKRFQLDQLGKQAEAARGRVSVLGQSMVKFQADLAGAQQKLAENKAVLASMPEKYGELARVASSAFEQVAAAQERLDDARQRADFAPDQQSYVQAVNDQVAAQAELNAAIAAGDEAFARRAAQYGTVEGAINSAEEAERRNKDAIDGTRQSILTATSAAQSYEAQQRALAASIAASATGWGQFGKNAQEFGTNLQSAGNALSSIGDKMTLVSGIAAMTFGRKIVSGTEEFGNAISQLGGYLDIQGAQLEEMSDQALDWGKKTQFSATEAANAMNELAKGGMTQAQISGGAMEATMELAAAGSLDMAQAASVAVQAIKTFGLDAADASSVADALAGAANESTAEVTELANGFKYVGGWASMAGWNINDVSGALALLSDHGLQSEMAGTALRNVMQRLAAPTDTAAELMRQYGFSVRDSSGQMVSATEVVRRLNDTFGQLGDAEKQNVLNDIFGARALPAAIALMDEGAESLQGYIDATTKAGYAGEMAQNRMGDLGWALEMLRGEAETAAVNFGQALTPTIIGVAKAIEDALGWFNSLSDAEKSNVANMALMAAAAGPVISVVGHLASGIGGIVSAIGTGASAIANFTQLMKGGGDATKVMAESIALAQTQMSGSVDGMEKVAERAAAIEQSMAALGTGMAVAFAAFVAVDLANTAKGVADNMQLIHDATDGIDEAMQAATASVEGLSSAQDSASTSSATLASTLADATEGLQAAADYADTMRESLSDMGGDTASVEHYAETIKELSSHSVLTAGELDLLKEAVDRYNEATGAAVTVTNEQTGALNVLPSQIDEVTEAYKRQVQQQTYMELWTEAIKAQAKNEEELERVTREMGDATRDASDPLKAMLIPLTGLNNLNNAHTAADMVKLGQSLQGLKDSGEDLASSVSYWEDKIESLGDAAPSFSSLETAMTAAGVTAKQQANLTEAQLAELEAAFDGTIQSIAAKLQSFGVSVGGVGRGAVDGLSDATDDYADALSSGIDEASKAAQKAQQRANDAAYREQQRAYDAEYKALQKALDAEYKAQQKSFDQEYKQLQKALDAEYKERQKALDKQYKAEQKSYDAAYKQRQKELDRQYDAYKKKLDAEEDALKKSLDSKYAERKKALDAELAQVKKANDARLKEQKKADDAETKAFKAETDRRVKALQAEYKERLRLLELQYGGTEIDAQIKSLKDQTKAERAEAKRREQEEKKAELQRAVEQAKTRRKRADAEKALNDYLADLAQEAREAERDAEIERLEDQKDLLKDELAAKKDALKEEYDARIEALKEQRSAEQEVLKEANDAEYEQLKEQLDAQYQLRKEDVDRRLQQVKDANQTELDALKEQHSALLDDMKERHAEQLELLKEQQQEQLDAIKEAHQAELDAMKEGHQERLDALKESQQAQLDSIKESHQAQLDALKQSQQDQLQALKDSMDDQLEAMKSGGENMVKSAKETGDALTRTTSAAKQGIKSGVKDFLSETTKSFANSSQEVLKSGEETGRGYPTNIADGLRMMYGAVNKEFERMMFPFRDEKNHTERYGIDMMRGLSSGLSGMAAGRMMDTALDQVMRTISNALGHSEWTEMSGYDMIQNFVSGIYRGDGILTGALSWVADLARSFLGHSVAKRGPLHEGGRGEALWGEHMVENFAGGMRSAFPELESQLERMAALIKDNTYDDSLSLNDPVADLIDSMRAEEVALAAQARRMADIVSDEFSPDVGASYSVGYDVRPVARLLATGVTEALRSGVPQRSGPTIVVREMHVRDESDIRRVSQRLYQLEAQADRRGL